jgi:hypothetical protein
MGKREEYEQRMINAWEAGGVQDSFEQLAAILADIEERLPPTADPGAATVRRETCQECGKAMKRPTETQRKWFCDGGAEEEDHYDIVAACRGCKKAYCADHLPKADEHARKGASVAKCPGGHDCEGKCVTPAQQPTAPPAAKPEPPHHHCACMACTELRRLLGLG